jgi:hypothetical protein
MADEEFAAMIAEFRAAERLLNELNDDHLGLYVYLLRDPRDGHVFYVGKGQRARVVGHMIDAVERERNGRSHEAKSGRIVDIIRAGERVEWMIATRNLPDDHAAEVCEAAIMCAIGYAPNAELTNKQSGQHAHAHGPIMMDDLASLAAVPVSPSQRVKALIFPIQKALQEGRSPDDAVSRSWKVSPAIRNMDGLVAVGVAQGVSRVARVIEGFQPEENGLWALRLASAKSEQLTNVRFTEIVNSTGYWQYGNYLGVEFDGNGKFRFWHGAANREWQPLN